MLAGLADFGNCDTEFSMVSDYIFGEEGRNHTGDSFVYTEVKSRMSWQVIIWYIPITFSFLPKTVRAVKKQNPRHPKSWIRHEKKGRLRRARI